MNELFDLMAQSLNEQIKDVEVRECPTDNPIIAGKSGGPFDNHLYCSFIIPDSWEETPEQIKTTHFDPASRMLASTLQRFQIVEAQPLPIPQIVNPNTGQRMPDGAIKKLIMAGDLPVRFTAMYDIEHQGVQYVADMLVRHVGNYYRTIINGPLHRLEMPFKDEPAEEMDHRYRYIPLERPDYYVLDEVANADAAAAGEDIEPQYMVLPGLDRNEMYPEAHLHYYCVKGDYCYYRGESVI